MFTHVDLNLPNLKRETIDGIRYYKIPGQENLQRLVSITSVTSHYNKEKFSEWREKVGEKEANRICKESTSIGTDTHTLTEQYLKNLDCNSDVLPMSEMLFQIMVPALNNINNIHALEGSLYSSSLGIAGTTDCIGEYTGDNGIPELAIIDFKTSKYPKPRKWIEDYFVQCCAYACMLHELTGLSVKKFVIIMGCRDGELRVYEEYDKKKYFNLLLKYIKKFVNDKVMDYECI
jgi:genome maintenance exonuclease 1